MIERIRRYFRYGSMRGLDPGDTDVVLRLQAAYYDKRIGELTCSIEQLDEELRHADIVGLADEYRARSVDALRASLHERYRSMPRVTYSPSSYRQGSTFGRFLRDYPVLLSTCHSLRDSVADGFLLDVLVIDEASQVGLLEAGLALSCCRNLVVVGDLRQLPQFGNDAAEGLEPPQPGYDCRRHNILSSMLELYSDIPRTLLKEHYRCDPAIIGFCNKAFYSGELIPYMAAGAEQPMVLAPTVAGNHMRQHRGGGRSNQREVDVIVNEVIPTYCPDVPGAEIGITTPYRRQVDKVADALIAEVEQFEEIQADTVHRFQGRQREVMILTTVLDETWRGRTGLKFADDPHLVNVAVSRAIRRFVLVTNNDMMPTSRLFRDLVDYIRYQTPGTEVAESAVVSVFDLLYRDYSARLAPLAARVRNETRYRSEDIVSTVLHDILTEERYAHLAVVRQVLLRNLLSGLDGLTPRQEAYVLHRASVDFVVYNRVSNRPVLAVEVDGFAFHENNPAQLLRDALKNDILAARGLPLLRLPTTGSGEENRIRRALDDAETMTVAHPQRDQRPTIRCHAEPSRRARWRGTVGGCSSATMLHIRTDATNAPPWRPAPAPAPTGHACSELRAPHRRSRRASSAAGRPRRTRRTARRACPAAAAASASPFRARPPPAPRSQRPPPGRRRAPPAAVGCPAPGPGRGRRRPRGRARPASRSPSLRSVGATARRCDIDSLASSLMGPRGVGQRERPGGPARNLHRPRQSDDVGVLRRDP